MENEHCMRTERRRRAKWGMLLFEDAQAQIAYMPGSPLRTECFFPKLECDWNVYTELAILWKLTLHLDTGYIKKVMVRQYIPFFTSTTQ